MAGLRIGVVSDTHMPRMAAALPPKLVEAFRNVDLILHLGDWVSLEVYEQLLKLAPVEGIAGNNDGEEIISRFGMKKVLEVEGVKLGLVHGHEPFGRMSTPDKAFQAFASEAVQAVLFGHSHQPYLERREGILLFNPGSPTDKRREAHYSVGLLRIEGGQIEAEHIFFAGGFR
ncbi:YfcE family phosphodiesterase [Paenibacillus sp. CAA11]|uniref:metallophosphoesterase family protein n=1 Tax=Paenibacillus sp. CAA11 TaxID=1532905 RepID=UPI000D3D7842|nr:metallophosphoesterase [Paenibacillus sp. CAA11]AWB46303.1 YfcE family phosphodiesterase [Paenibacillus sp. CAA11]